MRSQTRLVDMLAKVEKGPIMEEKAFDKLITATVKELLKKYDINYNREDAINMDDDLADRLFEAAIELATRVGIYCTSTHRKVEFTREEIVEALKWAPTELEYGRGLDKVTVKKRLPEDSTPVVNFLGPFGVPIEEDLYSKIMQSYAQSPYVDVIYGGCYKTINGFVPKTHSPWEVLAVWKEIEDMQGAARRANRPEMGLGSEANSVSEVGTLTASSYDGFARNDVKLACFISELKTDYNQLIRVAHTIKSGAVLHGFYNAIYGGMAGGAEGLALISTAGEILLSVFYMTTTNSMTPAHPFYNSNTAPEMVWAISAAQQALNRNTNILTTAMTSPSGGPATECLLYECATIAIMATVSGTSRIDGVRSAVGVELNHCSGLEGQFNAECANAALGMSREKANELIKEFQKEYVPLLGTLPIGKPFTEVYDLVTLKPTEEWQSMYDKVKNRLISMGVPL
jgi:methylamine--corrinoid protein Co-methyltransferase